MRRFLRGCVWPLACGFAVLVSGCGPDNETEANIKGTPNKDALDPLKGGMGASLPKNYPGLAKAQAKSAAAAGKAAAPAK
jgi:hypothetical protein